MCIGSEADSYLRRIDFCITRVGGAYVQPSAANEAAHLKMNTERAATLILAVKRKHSGRDCVKSLLSSYTGLYVPQSGGWGAYAQACAVVATCEMCSGSEEGSYLRLIDFCITRVGGAYVQPSIANEAAVEGVASAGCAARFCHAQGFEFRVQVFCQAQGSGG